MTKLSRRRFFKLGLSATAAGASVAALQQVHGASRPGPAPLPAAASSDFPESVVRTTCGLCPSGCGLDVRVVAGRAVKIEGNPLHPANQGTCCLKGQAALEALYSPERVLRPRLQTGARGSDSWQDISWEEALALLAQKLGGLRESGRPHGLALMHGDTHGQMRGLLAQWLAAYGSPNLVSHDSLDTQAARLVTFVTQGINGLPVYDLNNARYVLAFGGGLLETSRHVIGSLAGSAFMRRGRPQRGKLVTIHPRLSITAAKSDEWIPIRPGTLGALALGFAYVIINSGLYDADFVRDFTFGFDDFTDAAGQAHLGFRRLVLERYPLDRVAQLTGVAPEVIARLAGEFATNRPAVAVLPTEPGGLDAGNSLPTAMAIHALNALVGSIDQPGGVLVQRFPAVGPWPSFEPDAPAQAGLRQPRIDGAGSSTLPLAVAAYQDVAEHVLARQPYALEALLLYNANPVYEVPDGGRFLAALREIPFVASFAATLDETAAQADLVLPASTFLETWGDNYLEGTGFAGISLRQPVVPAASEARDPADVLLALARQLGGPLAQALPWADYRSLVETRLSALDLDWDKLALNGNWSEMVYFNAVPGSPAWADVVGRDRLAAPHDGRFDFFARELFAALPGQPDEAYLPHVALPATLESEDGQAADFPFLLLSQPPMPVTRSWQGVLPSLQEAYGLPVDEKWGTWVEVSPRAAAALRVASGDWVWVESAVGKFKAQVRVFAGLWPNAVFVPGGQGHHTLVRWGRGSPGAMVVGANPNGLGLAAAEPLCGQVVAGPTRVKVYRA